MIVNVALDENYQVVICFDCTSPSHSHLRRTLDLRTIGVQYSVQHSVQCTVSLSASLSDLSLASLAIIHYHYQISITVSYQVLLSDYHFTALHYTTHF